MTFRERRRKALPTIAKTTLSTWMFIKDPIAFGEKIKSMKQGAVRQKASSQTTNIVLQELLMGCRKTIKNAAEKKKKKFFDS